MLCRFESIKFFLLCAIMKKESTRTISSSVPSFFFLSLIEIISSRAAKIFFSLLLMGLFITFLFSNCLPNTAAVKQTTLRTGEGCWCSIWLTLFLQEIDMSTIFSLRQRNNQTQSMWQPSLISDDFITSDISLVFNFILLSVPISHPLWFHAIFVTVWLSH